VCIFLEKQKTTKQNKKQQNNKKQQKTKNKKPFSFKHYIKNSFRRV
jgi:hypothetical protein